MKRTSIILTAVFGLSLLPVSSISAGRDTVTLRARLSSAGPASATGEARLVREEGRTRFSVTVQGLDPGAYDLLVGGVLEGFVFVDEKRSGMARFDSRALHELTARQFEESDVIGLTFDPRGRSLQVARDGHILLEVIFPSRPGPARR